MKKKLVLLAITMCLCLMSTVNAQETYYVQSAKAKIMASPSFKAAVLGEAFKGFKLAAIGKQGMWMKVRFNDKDGFVSTLLVSNRPPMEKVGVIKGDDSEIKQGVRRRASSYTSAAAARGLAQDDRRRLSREEKSDYESIEKMESFTLSAEEVSRFMEGNKL